MRRALGLRHSESPPLPRAQALHPTLRRGARGGGRPLSRGPMWSDLPQRALQRTPRKGRGLRALLPPILHAPRRAAASAWSTTVSTSGRAHAGLGARPRPHHASQAHGAESSVDHFRPLSPGEERGEKGSLNTVFTRCAWRVYLKSSHKKEAAKDTSLPLCSLKYMSHMTGRIQKSVIDFLMKNRP